MIDKLRYSDVCGLFGKIPQQADFVGQHLNESITTTWHRWIANGLSVAQEQLGEQWLNYYLTSPVWRFIIAPQVLDATGMGGIMIPCVDSIGRYFPLIVGAMGHFDYWQASAEGKDWFDTLERYALSILEEQLDYGSLTATLDLLPLPTFFTHAAFKSEPTAKDLPETLSLSESMPGASSVLPQTLFNTMLSAHYDRPCLWWTNGSDHIAPCLHVSDGLPDSGQFAALLDGQWHRWGWSEVHSISIEPLEE